MPELSPQANLRQESTKWYAARMAEVAVHFEAYMRAHLGPLQGLLEQVVRADSDLHRAVVDRRGSWLHATRNCRSARRDSDAPNLRYGTLGFRLLREMP